MDSLSTENCGHLDIRMACVYCTTLNAWCELSIWWLNVFSAVNIYVTFLCSPFSPFTLRSLPWIWVFVLYPGQVGRVHGRNEEKFQIILSLYMSWKMWMYYYAYYRCLACSQPAWSMMDQVVFAPGGKSVVCPSRWLEVRLLCHCRFPSVPWFLTKRCGGIQT